jgi:hypothetical protein
MLNHKERTTKASLLYDKPRLSKPNKTMTKDKSAMMNLSLKQKAALILSHNCSLQHTWNFGMQKPRDINIRIRPETGSMKDKFKFIPLRLGFEWTTYFSAYNINT